MKINLKTEDFVAIFFGFSCRILLFKKFLNRSIYRHHHHGENESSGTLGTYNWTEIERYDATDLQLLLKDLEPHTKYEILLQAYNQFGRGPVAKIEAETGADGNNAFS